MFFIHKERILFELYLGKNKKRSYSRINKHGKHSNVSNKVEKCLQSLAVCKIIKIRYSWSYFHFVYVPKVSLAPSSLRRKWYICEYLVFVFNDDAVIENVGFLSYAVTNSTLYFSSRWRMLKEMRKALLQNIIFLKYYFEPWANEDYHFANISAFTYRM